MTDSTDRPVADGQRISRRDLLKKAGAGAVALGAAGSAAPFSFAGPLRHKGRWLKGDLSINHASIIHEVEAKVGKYGDLGKRSTYNPKTKKYFAVSDNYVPDPVIWRHDLWNGVGESPATWDHVRAAAPKLKAIGHPIGIGQ